MAAAAQPEPVQAPQTIIDQEDGTVKIYENSYKIGPDEGKELNVLEIRREVQKVMKEEFEGKEYDENWASEAIKRVTTLLQSRIKAIVVPRFKTVVQLIVGQTSGQGVRVVSRCLWDTNLDNSITETVETVCGKRGWKRTRQC